jgi:hypothetical protein
VVFERRIFRSRLRPGDDDDHLPHLPDPKDLDLIAHLSIWLGRSMVVAQVPLFVALFAIGSINPIWTGTIVAIRKATASRCRFLTPAAWN